jgi:leucyl-tRNA synthetase
VVGIGPQCEAKWLTETEKEYPVSVNGKLRTNVSLPLDMEADAVEKLILANEVVQKWVNNQPIKKFIFVKGRMINVVV